MTPAEQYRVKASAFLKMAMAEADARLQYEYAAMAQNYLRLATLADKNSHNDIVYETPKHA